VYAREATMPSTHVSCGGEVWTGRGRGRCHGAPGVDQSVTPGVGAVDGRGVHGSPSQRRRGRRRRSAGINPKSVHLRRQLADLYHSVSEWA